VGLAHARVEKPNCGNGQRLEHEAHRRHRVRFAADQISTRHAGRAHDGCVVKPQPIEQEEQRGSETLHLQPALGLGAEALEDPVRRVGGEGRHDHGGDGDRGTQAVAHPAKTGPLPDVDAGEREENERVDLRADREPEHGESGQLPAPQQEPQRQNGQ